MRKIFAINGWFMMLTEQQKHDYHEQGFLVIRDFVSPALCAELKTRAIKLISEFNPQEHKTVFSTTSQAHAKHDYFLSSGQAIRFFFEEGVFNEAGELTKDKMLSINKIGHALHDLDPLFECFSRQHKFARLVSDLGVANPLLLQSMYICKQPYIGGEVTAHQDSTYLYVEGEPVVGLWFALEDATLENGCLWAIPGGHRTQLKSRFFRTAEGATTEVYDNSPWKLESMQPLEVPQGSLIVLHGLLPHMSKTNHSARSRHAYSLHVISGDYHYPEDNWLQRPNDMPLRGFN